MNGVAVLLIGLSLLFPSVEEKTSAEVVFCQFDLAESIKAAHASFNLIYSFKVDETGNPAKIVKVSDDYVGEDKVTPCLKKWHFSGFSGGATIVVVFRWEHAKGWVDLSVTAPGFSQKIKLEGERCPYQKH